MINHADYKGFLYVNKYLPFRSEIYLYPPTIGSHFQTVEMDFIEPYFSLSRNCDRLIRPYCVYFQGVGNWMKIELKLNDRRLEHWNV